MHHSIIATLAFTATAVGSTLGTTAQTLQDNALIPTEAEVQSPPQTTPMKGRIKPLFWEAEIGKSALFIPLREIEFVSMQNYKVVSSAQQENRDVLREQSEAFRVRELTVSTKSQNLIRIYYLDKLTDSKNRENDGLSTLKKLEVLQGKLSTVQEQRFPVKHYPETTHKHMVEYRVSKEADIEKLYASLQETLVDYHAFQLIDDQKPDTISSVRASESK